MAQAQSTNADHFAQLAAQCVAALPNLPKTFILEPAPRMPYLRTKILANWSLEERTVFLPESNPSQALAKLKYQVEGVQVQYTPTDRKTLTRTLSLALQIAFYSAQGNLVSEQVCSKIHTDRIPRTQIAVIEDPLFPETKGTVPPPRRAQWLQTALLSTGLGLTVWLFFTVRSASQN